MTFDLSFKHCCKEKGHDKHSTNDAKHDEEGIKSFASRREGLQNLDGFRLWGIGLRA